mgnify:CR=1 FL=1|tara:strand:+ start:13364 stop:13582 length:219 start_codon:yes stop_codon:yes gene_type:complete
MKFYEGDLIETLTYKGEIIYGIVLESVNRFNYTEVRILSGSRIIAVVHDGRKGGIKLIQRIDNEKRATKQTI